MRLALLILLSVWTRAATDYFVDGAAGNDASAGTATGSAWRHSPGDAAATGNAASATLVSGDRVIFKGGVVYRGGMTNTVSGVTYKGDYAWGTGKGIASGAVLVTGTWTNCASSGEVFGNGNYANIWRTAIQFPAQTALNTIIADGVMMMIAQDVNASTAMRWDEVTTWRSVPASSVSATALTDAGIFTQADSTFWVGAFLGVHHPPNAVSTHVITAFNTATDTVSVDLSNVPSAVFYDPTPFSVMGHPFHIDQAGEYGVKDGYLYIWPPGGVNPNTLTIEVAKLKQGIVHRNVDNVTTEGIKFSGYFGGEDGSNTGGAVGNDGSGSYANHVIQNCDIENIRSMTGCPTIGAGRIVGVTISGVTITNCWGSRGMIVSLCHNPIVTNSSLFRLGGTGVYFAACTNGIVSGLVLNGLRGPHGNGLSIYQGSSDFYVENVYIRECGSPMTWQEAHNITFVNIDADMTYGKSEEGGGMSGTIRILNSTFANSPLHNALDLGRSGAIPTYEIHNSMFDGLGYQVDAVIHETFNIYLGYNENFAAPIPGTGSTINTNTAAIFNNYATGDYSLKTGSPAIDVGTDLSAYLTTDLLSIARPQGAAFDLGAYEFTSVSLSSLPVVSGGIRLNGGVRF